MLGFPKHLNSKADYLFIKNTFPREKWETTFKASLDERLQWFNVGKITDTGLTDSTHKVITNDMNGETVKYQYELREDQNCSLYRLGFTVEEVEGIINA